MRFAILQMQFLKRFCFSLPKPSKILTEISKCDTVVKGKTAQGIHMVLGWFVQCSWVKKWPDRRI